jgi:hypothetical protein
MYDLLTSSLLFVVLVPGVVLSIGSGVVAALVHAAVFYVIQRFISQFVPWWVIWAIAIGAIGWRLSSGSSTAGTSSGY